MLDPIPFWFKIRFSLELYLIPSYSLDLFILDAVLVQSKGVLRLISLLKEVLSTSCNCDGV